MNEIGSQVEKVQEWNYSAEEENKLILNAYRGMLRCTPNRSKEDTRLIRKAFNVSMEAHKDMRRKSGEPYIFHPIAVARIAAEEIGLGATSVICALLHDTVEDTYITLTDIETMFGKKVASIIDGLTKISGVFDQTVSVQAENFRKMLLTLSDDVRVILIKFADRLHNMRTLGSMRRDKQLKIASETMFLYAPLAHRLGLYAIKTELEDLAFKFKEPEVYNQISSKIRKTESVRKRFIDRFSLPIKRELEKSGYSFEVKGRPKTTLSIYRKMQKKNIPFEEVYDVFAIRIILNSKPESEKTDCWKVYSIVTDFYKPNPDRLRDWVSTPKTNGYESLHTTVMSPKGRWVEVQIRTNRMDEIAERGYAAHWKYKDGVSAAESGLERWLTQIRELLESKEIDALDFIDDFKLNLFAEEIFVFTPKGDLRMLPSGATILDLAFDIHSQLGEKCIGAKVNHRLVPINHKLSSGDQVEIITTDKQNPKEEWVNFVETHKAKAKIKELLRYRKKKFYLTGQEQFDSFLRKNKIEKSHQNIQRILRHFNLKTDVDLYYRIAKDGFNLIHILDLKDDKGNIVPAKRNVNKTLEIFNKLKKNKESFLIGDETSARYTLADCCRPIEGDDVFGIISYKDGIIIHRTSCKDATQLMSNYADKILKANWISDESIEFLAGVKFTGLDEMGLVHRITGIIARDLTVNMKSISFESDNGIFTGKILAYVNNTQHLDKLIGVLSDEEGVLSVDRINLHH